MCSCNSPDKTWHWQSQGHKFNSHVSKINKHKSSRVCALGLSTTSVGWSPKTCSLQKNTLKERQKCFSGLSIVPLCMRSGFESHSCKSLIGFDQLKKTTLQKSTTQVWSSSGSVIRARPTWLEGCWFESGLDTGTCWVVKVLSEEQWWRWISQTEEKIGHSLDNRLTEEKVRPQKWRRRIWRNPAPQKLLRRETARACCSCVKSKYLLLFSLLSLGDPLLRNPPLVWSLISAATCFSASAEDSNRIFLYGRTWPYHWAIGTCTSAFLFWGAYFFVSYWCLKKNINRPKRNPWTTHDWTRAPPKIRTLEYTEMDETFWANDLHLLSQWILWMKEWMKTDPWNNLQRTQKSRDRWEGLILVKFVSAWHFLMTLHLGLFVWNVWMQRLSTL